MCGFRSRLYILPRWLSDLDVVYVFRCPQVEIPAWDHAKKDIYSSYVSPHEFEQMNISSIKKY